MTSSSTSQQKIAQFRQKLLGRGLRRLYAQLALEPTPLCFLALLEESDQRLFVAKNPI
jgi:hypothetical protein